jgi:glycosyltransferase 2 family protein
MTITRGRGPPPMKALNLIMAIGGLLVGAALVAHFGFSEVAHALLAIRWTGLVVIVVYHLGVLSLLGLCWYFLIPDSGPSQYFIWSRVTRDSCSELLPFSQVGGFVAGARLLTLLGIPLAVAVASLIVDVTLEVLAQLAYTGLGLGIFSAQQPDSHLIVWTTCGLLVALLAVIAFIIVQRVGFGRLERITSEIENRWIKSLGLQSASIHQAIKKIYRRGGTLYAVGAFHFLAWVASSVEAWIALSFMGRGLSIGSVIAIESLLYAIRSVAFAVPNALGVQEAAYVVLGAMFGLGPDTALALSLVKRARDLVIGVPALISWQILESRRWVVKAGLGQA